MTDAEREQIKLRANALDRASTACLAAGLLTPFANILYTGNANPNGWALFFLTVLYVAGALGLHQIAFQLLKGLDQ